MKAIISLLLFSSANASDASLSSTDETNEIIARYFNLNQKPASEEEKQEKLDDFIKEQNQDNQKRFEQAQKAQPIGNLISSFGQISSGFMDKINELNTITQQTKYDIVKDLLQGPKAATASKESSKTEKKENNEKVNKVDENQQEESQTSETETEKQDQKIEQIQKAKKQQKKKIAKKVAEPIQASQKVSKHKKQEKIYQTEESDQEDDQDDEQPSLTSGARNKQSHSLGQFGTKGSMSIVQVSSKSHARNHVKQSDKKQANKSKFISKIEERLKKINADLKPKTIGEGTDEEVTLQIVQQNPFNLSAENITGFLKENTIVKIGSIIEK